MTTMNQQDGPRAWKPDDLEGLFVQFVNQQNLEALLGLYEQGAVLKDGSGTVYRGVDEIRSALSRYVATAPVLDRSDQYPSIVAGDIALTSSRHSDGSVSVEIARRQPDGTWRWIIDQFAVP